MHAPFIRLMKYSSGTASSDNTLGFGQSDTSFVRSAMLIGAVPQLKNVMRRSGLFTRAISAKKTACPDRSRRIYIESAAGRSASHTRL